MPTSFASSPRSRSSLVPIASLLLMVGLTSSLGLARTVWGGPPADAEPPAAEPEAAPEQPAEAGDDLVGTDPLAAGAAGSPEPAATDTVVPEPVLDEGAASVPGASSLRAKMEAGMSDVMDLGTSELLIIRDPGASEQARGFALEKLEAASGRIDKLVAEAKACAGQQGPEDEVDVTRREADEPDTIPILNPSSGLGENPVPPPIDGGWPPAASPFE
jgi:hypothetical protein